MAQVSTSSSKTLSKSRPVRIFIHTGEVSGDLQGGVLIEALNREAARRHLQLTISAMGGHRMAQAGATLIGNTVAVSAVGLFESWPYLISTLQLQRRAQRHLLTCPPDVAVLLDYMGPNIAIGNFMRAKLPHLPLVYYIAPQQWVWALGLRDTRRILRVADKLLAIFPEEARYFAQYSEQVRWVGHPLIDTFTPAPESLEAKIGYRQAARQRLGLSTQATIITLLPASRQQELTYIMPTMFEAASLIQQRLKQPVTFLVPVSQSRFRGAIEAAIRRYGLQAEIIDHASQDAIAAADLAITKSGTANLEIALMGVPQVVMYRLNRATAWVAKHILRFSVEFVSPVNLVEMKPVVPEFIQWAATPEAIAQESLQLLLNDDKRQAMIKGYAQMRRAMGTVGVCDRTAREILDMVPVSTLRP
ncbi:MAG: lipid-A-disaccharide synthase [Cyanobacteria bacterium P01_A01_bin.114]